MATTATTTPRRTAQLPATSKSRGIAPCRERRRVTALVAHPIQYQAPLFRVLAADPELDFRVMFLDDHSLHEHHDAGFGATFAWDVPLVEGYQHEFVVRGRRSRATDLPQLARLLRAERPEALWIHGWGCPLLSAALVSGRSLADRLLIRAETRLDRGANGRLPFVRDRIHTRLLAGVDGALAIGRDNHAFLQARGVPGERIFHMPYAVDAQRFGAAGDQRDLIRQEHGVRAGNLVFLFCGKLREHKAPRDLGLALLRARAHGAQVEGWFVGTGPEHDALRRLASGFEGESGVRLLGFRNQTELPAIYAGADVLCLPSKFEPWGLVANEGAHAGLALLLSEQVGAARDLVLPGETGHTFEAGNVDELARHILQLDGDRLATRRLGQRARARAASYNFANDQLGLHAALRVLFP